jgi:DNA polymerase-3 subunit gamma/tau
MITNQGWNAILKLIEEPPAKSIFIFCTTDPQKIPKTILSRVQRYDFQRISQKGIVDRLKYILDNEWDEHPDWDAMYEIEALEYIAKLADGGMRDAITLLDKVLAYTKDIELEAVVNTLGTIEYHIMFELTESLMYSNTKKTMITIVEEIHNSGKDLKTFLKQYTHFLLDIQKYAIGCDWKYINIPKINTYEKWLKNLTADEFTICSRLLDCCLKLNSDIKYSNSPKLDIETGFILQYGENK